MSSQDGQDLVPCRAPSARAGHIETDKSVDQNVQAAGRDINQDRIGAVIITHNHFNNIYLSPNTPPAELTRIVRTILEYPTQPLVDNGPSADSVPDPTYQDVTLKALNKEDIHTAVRAIQPEIESTGYEIFQLSKSTTNLDSRVGQMFRIRRNDTQTTQDSEPEDHGSGGHLAGSAVYTISDSNITRPHTPVRYQSESSIIENHRTPSLTSGTGSNALEEQYTPETMPRVEDLPLKSEGKILYYSYEGWEEEREKRQSMEAERVAEQVRFNWWLVLRLQIILLCYHIVLPFIFIFPKTQLAVEDDSEEEVPHQSPARSARADEQLVDQPQPEEDIFWSLDPSTATCFQQWRDSLPQINHSFSDSSSGSASSERRISTPSTSPSGNNGGNYDDSDSGHGAHTPGSNIGSASSSGSGGNGSQGGRQGGTRNRAHGASPAVYYDANLCLEPQEIASDFTEISSTSNSGRNSIAMTSAQLALMEMTFGVAMMSGMPLDTTIDERLAAVRITEVQTTAIDVASEVRHTGSQHFKEMLGIPSGDFGYPDRELVELRLGIRRRQPSTV